MQPNEAGDPIALNSHGMAALSRHDFAQAARFFEQAARLDPTAKVLWINLATAQRQLGADAAERAALDQVLALDQTDFMANLRLAQWHERRGESADAAARWRGVIALAPAIEQRSPELQALLDHAQTYIAQEHSALAAVLDSQMKEAIDGAAPSARRRFGAAMDFALGRRSIYANECSGLYYPFLPADEYFDRELFPWFEALESHTEAITEEFLAIYRRPDAGFAPYVKQPAGTPQNRWTQLDGSTDWSSLYLWKYGVPNQPVCDACPATAAAIAAVPSAALPGRAPTAFFSVLAPHSHIPPHTGVTNTRAIVHLPLIVPPDCAFRVGGERREWVVGQAFAFDDTIEHEAWNGSDELRAVLILDVWNPHLSQEERDLIAQFYEVADASGHRPQMLDVSS
jgi:aspartate beta-hydroxylase